MGQQYIISALIVRKTTIEETLLKRQKNEHDFSSWRLEDTKELDGRLKEINNTIDMFHAYSKEGVVV